MEHGTLGAYSLFVCAGAAVPLPTEEQMLEVLVFKDGPSQSLYY